MSLMSSIGSTLGRFGKINRSIYVLALGSIGKRIMFL